MALPAKTKLPEGMAAQLGRVVGLLEQVSLKRSDYSPYSIAALEVGSKQIKTWLKQLSESGELRDAQGVFALMKRVEEEARNLILGRISFAAQLVEHLERIQYKLDRARSERKMIEELASAFGSKVVALRGRASVKDEMSKLHAEATALEKSVEQKLSMAQDGRARVARVGFRA